MLENLDNKNELREYLLGKTAGEEILNQIEERLLDDREFFDRLEIAEDDLIEEYISGNLPAADLESFTRLFINVPERQEKIRFSQALRQLAKEENQKKENGIFSFLSDWILLPQVSIAVIVLFAAGVFIWLFLFGIGKNDSDKSLAELKSIYKTERPLEARLVGLEYSPFSTTRGEGRAKEENQNRRRKIELDLENAAEKYPNEGNFNSLGFFYLTEKRFDESVAQFENSLKLNPKNTEARTNLAAAFYEKSKAENPAEQSKYLNKSLEELNKALEINPDFTEAIFDKALILQQLNQKDAASEIWRQYLARDANSKWADEARRHLQQIEKY